MTARHIGVCDLEQTMQWWTVACPYCCASGLVLRGDATAATLHVCGLCHGLRSVTRDVADAYWRDGLPTAQPRTRPHG